jgi:hypothetical protein
MVLSSIGSGASGAGCELGAGCQLQAGGWHARCGAAGGAGAGGACASPDPALPLARSHAVQARATCYPASTAPTGWACSPPWARGRCSPGPTDPTAATPIGAGGGGLRFPTQTRRDLSARPMPSQATKITRPPPLCPCADTHSCSKALLRAVVCRYLISATNTLVKEPNNLALPPEMCVAANASTAFGTPRAWGWADWGCGEQLVSLCRLARERTVLLSTCPCLPGTLNLRHLFHAEDVHARGIHPSAPAADGPRPLPAPAAAEPKISACTPRGTPHRYHFNTAPLTFPQAEAVCNTLGGHLVSFANLTDQTAAEQCFVNSAALLPTFHKAYWLGLRVGERTSHLWWECCAGRLWGGLWADFCGMIREDDLVVLSAAFGAPGTSRQEARPCAHPLERMLAPATTPLPLRHCCLTECCGGAEADVALWPNFTWVDHTWATSVGGFQHWGNLTLAGGAKLLEPNNLSSPEHCAAANFSTSFRGGAGWADLQCSTGLPSMCEAQGWHCAAMHAAALSLQPSCLGPCQAQSRAAANARLVLLAQARSPLSRTLSASSPARAACSPGARSSWRLQMRRATAGSWAATWPRMAASTSRRRWSSTTLTRWALQPASRSLLRRRMSGCYFAAATAGMRALQGAGPASGAAPRRQRVPRLTWPRPACRAGSCRASTRRTGWASTPPPGPPSCGWTPPATVSATSSRPRPPHALKTCIAGLSASEGPAAVGWRVCAGTRPAPAGCLLARHIAPALNASASAHAATYTNWGTSLDGEQEPNNLSGR